MISEELAFVKDLEKYYLIVDIGRVLRFMRLLWAIGEDWDHSIFQNLQPEHNFEVEELDGVETFILIRRVNHVVRLNY